MSVPFAKIASQTKNCNFGLQSIQKFLALMATQQTEYSDFSYKANGLFSLVLSAKKNLMVEVALKILECTDLTFQKIQDMQNGHAISKQLPFCDYFMVVNNQFFITEADTSVQQDQSNNTNIFQKKVYFVQEMELTQGNFLDYLQQQSYKNKNSLLESVKVSLAIQMLDAVNLLHQRQLAHGNITIQHFLISQSEDSSVLLKLCNPKFSSPANPINTVNSVSESQSKKSTPLMAKIQRDCLEQDLISLGIVILQLDNIGTTFYQSQLDETNILEIPSLNRNTLLYKIASSFLSNSKENIQCARSMLLLLLQKQTETTKIPLFSIVLKSQLDSLRLQIPIRRIILDSILSEVSRQRKLKNISSQFDANRQAKTQLTADLLQSALSIMFDWKDFNGKYDILGVGMGSIVLGANNLKEKRKCALRLSLCSNKAEKIKEIGIMRTCQSPNVVKFYGHYFFKDLNGNEFVVYELERCKYSLIHHLELQRINGTFSYKKKLLLMLKIFISVSFLHEKQIIHRNIKLDSFLITENESGEAVVKLGNFSHALQLQDLFKKLSTLEDGMFGNLFESPINCILQSHNRESPLYFAPERWENSNLSSYFTDRFSVGLCIFLLDNYLVCSEEQLARQMLSAPQGFAEICLKEEHLIEKKTGIFRIAKQLLGFFPHQRKSLRNFTEKTIEFWNQSEIFLQDSGGNAPQQQMMLNIERDKDLDKIQKAPLRFVNLSSISLNLNWQPIGDTEAKNLFNPISNLLNLSRFSFNLRHNSKKLSDAYSLLSPLSRLVKLSSISLDLNANLIGDSGAQYLLNPLSDLLNISNLNLNLKNNYIGEIGAKSLLSPLNNLLNLSSLVLNLKINSIGAIGAESLLNPLRDLHNLSNLALNLDFNSIGDKGAESLLNPLADLLYLSTLVLHLDHNIIRKFGAKSLLSPLSKLSNLSSFALYLNSNLIGDIGAGFLLSPLSNLFNLQSLTLNLDSNQFFGSNIGEKSLLSPLSGLLNISNLALSLASNSIRELRGQVLLSPLATLTNLLSLILNLKDNSIRDVGAETLLLPLANLFNLSSLSLNLSKNQITKIGAKSLLSPLSKLFKLQSLALNLNVNTIGDEGAKSLLSPLSNLLNLSYLAFDLDFCSIGDKGAEFLLQPLSNHINLSTQELNLCFNNISDIGANSLFFPLSSTLSLSRLGLKLNGNFIRKQINHLFKVYLKNMFVSIAFD